MRRAAIIFVAFCAIGWSRTAAADLRDLLTDDGLLDAFAAMLDEAKPWRLGCETELAAFVVGSENGVRSLQRWPAVDCKQVTSLQATYLGSIPKGALAIVHTHPYTRPWPSPDDAVLAVRMHIPVLVLSRAGITASDPATGLPLGLLMDARWPHREKRQR